MAGAGANSTKLPPQAPHLESSGQTITLRRGLVPAEIWNNSQCRPGGVEAARKHIVASMRRSNANSTPQEGFRGRHGRPHGQNLELAAPPQVLAVQLLCGF